MGITNSSRQARVLHLVLCKPQTPKGLAALGFGGVFDSFLKLALNFWVAQTLPT